MNYWGTDKALATEMLAEYVERVFRRMSEFHTAEKRNKALGLPADFNDDEYKAAWKTWAYELGMMTPEMVQRGGRKLKAVKFCPTLAQFIQLCIPCAEESFHEAQAGVSARSAGKFGAWTCPAVYWSAVDFGVTDLKLSNWNFTGKRWTRIYEGMLKKQEAGNLQPIPEPVAETLRIESKAELVVPAKVAEFVSENKAKTNTMKIQVQWAFLCESRSAALKLCDGLNGLVHRSTLAEAGKHNLRLGKLAKDGERWTVGNYTF